MVEVIGAPGFCDFQAKYIADARNYKNQLLCVVETDGEWFVIPAQYVMVSA